CDGDNARAIESGGGDGRANGEGLGRAFHAQSFGRVLLGVKHRGGIVWHAGVYYEGMVSHCELASRQVRLDSLEDLKDTYSEIES
ncbi:hypothetical protein FGD18_23805, partial [Salmonella enterica subsp. enterica serovar Heidelberg]